MLFTDAAKMYMDDKSKRLRGTTLEGYESAIRCHLAPMWGARELEEITFEELQAWIDGFAKPGAAEKAFKTFRQIYRWALRRRQLRIWDVTQGVELPQKPTVRRAHRGRGLAQRMGPRAKGHACGARSRSGDRLQDAPVGQAAQAAALRA